MFPQAPQFAESRFRSLHRPEQSVRPTPQAVAVAAGIVAVSVSVNEDVAVVVMVLVVRAVGDATVMVVAVTPQQEHAERYSAIFAHGEA